MKPASFEYLRPSTLDEALALLARHEGARAIAGGQSLLPVMNFRLAAPSMLVDIAGLPGLREIEIGADALTLGALVRWCDIERDERLAVAHPLLAAAVRHVAHYQIRNRGTVGGSLAHADPAAELPGIAVTCGGTVLLAGPGGRREVAAERFFLGALSTALEAGGADRRAAAAGLAGGVALGVRGVLAAARRFRAGGGGGAFRLRPGWCVQEPHVGVIGANPRPIRLAAVERLLVGQALTPELIAAAGDAARGAVDAADDLHGSEAYRRAFGSGQWWSGHSAGGGAGMSAVRLTVNGAAVSVRGGGAAVAWRIFCADRVGITGVHLGCEHGVCGACTVIVDGKAVRACLMLAVQADGADIVTVEGLAAADGTLHEVQQALRDEHGLQCGFCTPGIVMTLARADAGGGAAEC